MAQPAATAYGSPSLPGWRALRRVLTDPGETFRRLGDQPPVLPGYLLQMAVGLLVFALTVNTTMALLDQGMAISASQPGAQEMPPGFAPVMKWVSVGFVAAARLAGPWLAGLLLTLIALFVGQFQGGGVPFSAYLGMIGYARVPLALSALLSGVWTALTDKPLIMSLTVFLSPEASPYLKGLLSMFNPFGLWYYALLAIGFAALFKRPPGKGWALPALLFVVATLASVGTAGFAATQAGKFQ